MPDADEDRREDAIDALGHMSHEKFSELRASVADLVSRDGTERIVGEAARTIMAAMNSPCPGCGKAWPGLPLGHTARNRNGAWQCEDTGTRVVIKPVQGLDPCPECAQGKCRNCLGETWDPAADDTAPCPCAAATPHVVGR